MRQRCSNPNVEGYERYGGRGIVVHPAFNDFETFFREIGPRPTSAHSIDRIDNLRGYEPGNVHWATIEEQANNKRNNRYLTSSGQTMTVAQWARHLGLPRATLTRRLNHLRWTVEQALYTPVGSQK